MYVRKIKGRFYFLWEIYLSEAERHFHIFLTTIQKELDARLFACGRLAKTFSDSIWDLLMAELEKMGYKAKRAGG